MGQTGEGLDCVAQIRERRFVFELHRYRDHVPIHYGNAVAMGAYFCRERLDCAGEEVAQDLLRLLLHLFFFVADERNYIGGDVHGCYAGIACAGDGLHGGDHYAFNSELLHGRQRHGQHYGGTVWIGDDLPWPAPLFALACDQLQVLAIDLWN